MLDIFLNESNKFALLFLASPASTTQCQQQMALVFELSRVKLNETQSWCYHEGSHGHNPEYGSTHTLTIAQNGSVAEHTSVEYQQNSNVNKSPVAGVLTFWEIHTTGESMVPKEVSPTEEIGHSHRVSLEGDQLRVDVNYQKTGEKKTTTLSVATLYQKFVDNGGTKLAFKY